MRARRRVASSTPCGEAVASAELRAVHLDPLDRSGDLRQRGELAHEPFDDRAQLDFGSCGQHPDHPRRRARERAADDQARLRSA